MVCLHHFNPIPNYVTGGILGLLRNMMIEFYIGVPLFFVLSGFLITLRYYGTERWSVSWWGPYLRNRVARIYPMYFLLTTVVFALGYAQGQGFDFNVWLLNVTFLRAFFDEYKNSGIGQGWTLTVEECFYFAAPVAFMFHRSRTRLLWVLPLVLAAIGSLLVMTLGPLNNHGLFGNFRFMLLYTFFGRSIEFFAGVQLALWYGQGKLRPSRLPALRTVLGILLILGVVFALIAVRGPYEYGQQHPFGIVINNLALPVGVVVFYAGLLTENTWLRCLLASRPLQILGKSSYVFYLIHMGAIQVFLKQYTSNSIQMLLLLNLLSIALYYWLEEPLNRWLRASKRLKPVTNDESQTIAKPA